MTIKSQEPRPNCISEGCHKKAMPSRKSRHGFQLWYKYCSNCCKKYYGRFENPRGSRRRNKTYKKSKLLKCQFCNFEAVDLCQLDVDHIDGNHKNNSPLNLQTLCANCHRLKTKVNNEGIYKARH